jgi:hypothetical protein
MVDGQPKNQSSVPRYALRLDLSGNFITRRSPFSNKYLKINYLFLILLKQKSPLGTSTLNLEPDAYYAGGL